MPARAARSVPTSMSSPELSAACVMVAAAMFQSRLFVALAFGVTVASSASVAGTKKRAFTLADLYKIKTVGSPVYSPDGKTIVYPVKTTDLPTSKSFTNLWRVTDAGSERLTTSDAVDDQAVFSPDGKQ